MLIEPDVLWRDSHFPFIREKRNIPIVITAVNTSGIEKHDESGTGNHGPQDPKGEALNLSLYFMVTHQLEEENSKYASRLPHTQKVSPL